MSRYLSSTDKLAEDMGISDTAINRWRRGETVGIRPMLADQCAIGLGLHPREIWGSDWDIE